VIWSTVFIELWKRKEAEYAFKWGTLDSQDDLITEPRPEYTVCIHPLDHSIYYLYTP